MKNNNYTLTKTKITSGLQCHKKLWFDFHEPIKKDKFVFHSGNRFGAIVRKNYGQGLDLSDNFDVNDVVDRTQKAIKSDDINVIYEGAFIYLDTLVKTDVLIRKKNGWELLEAKSSTRLKEEHIPDIAIQSFIVKECMKRLGANLTSIKLIHINKDFTYKGDQDYKDLINDENDVTSTVILKEKEVPNYIKDLIPLANKNSPCPIIAMGDHCKNPYPCDYQDRCKSLLPKSNVTSYSILPYKSKELKKYCKEKEIIDLQNVPTKFLNEKHNHKNIQEAHKTDKPWFSKNLKNVFKDFSFPFYFMDFETVTQGVPIIKGTKPYYHLPFQWSVHKLESIDKEIKLNDAESFLDFEDQDIERKFIESLLKAVGEHGTVFVHSSFEKSVLDKLKDKDNCKDLADKIDKLISRLKDTLKIVRKNFYSPLMNGKYTIKNIIKAIPSNISYDVKDNIASGEDAQLAWFICTDPKTTQKERQQQINLLKEYCSKDTLAIYDLVKYLINN